MRRALFSSRNQCPRPIQASEYVDRRAKLIDDLKVDDKTPLVLLQSAVKSFSAPDVPHNFRQCSNFRYLTGCLEPNSFLIINGKKSTLFVHEKSKHEKLWEGDGQSFDKLKTQANLDQVLPLTELAGFIASELSVDKLLGVNLHKLENADVQMLIDKFPGQRVNLNNALDNCRWIKSEAELDNMRHAAVIGSEAMNSLIQQASTISHESVVVGLLEYEMRLRGADSQAYPPVVASGSRANTIHYIDSNQAIESASCVLVDAGADFRGYVSDITRSFPISGHFSNPQLEMYEALNEIHQECLNYVSTVRPLKLNELFFHMLAKMSDVLSSMVFFKQNLSQEEAIRACEGLCEHHISHYLGMDVHDCPTTSRSIELPPNCVITVEPGIYVQHDNPLVRNEFKGIGFRIEDDVLVTEMGSEVLSRTCVRDAKNIEALMSC